MTDHTSSSVSDSAKRQRPDDAVPPPRAWQRMLSGRRLDLLNPAPEDVEIEDIAHGLARVARWNGQTTGDHALSVAQHVLVVEQIAQNLHGAWEPNWQLAALLHDAPEYVVGDLISPFKTAIGLDYKAFENKLLEAVHVRFDIPAQLPADVTSAIKNADRIAAYFEATVLAGFSKEEGRLYFGTPDGISATLQNELAQMAPWPASQSQQRFLERFAYLSRAQTKLRK